MERKNFKWIDALCIVTLDIKIGLVIERIYPEGLFSREDLTCAAMLSFPECNGSDQDEIKPFFYKFRLNQAKTSLKAAEGMPKQFLFGYSYYLERKDPSHPRGYFQKAFVILTKYYFCNFYKELVLAMGPSYFKTEDPEYLQAFYNINYRNYMKLL